MVRGFLQSILQKRKHVFKTNCKNNIFDKTVEASILNVLYEFQVQIKDVISFPLSFWLLSIICLAYYVAIFPFVSLGVPFFQKKFQFTQKNANFIASVPYLISAPGKYFFLNVEKNQFFEKMDDKHYTKFVIKISRNIIFYWPSFFFQPRQFWEYWLIRQAEMFSMWPLPLQ